LSFGLYWGTWRQVVPGRLRPTTQNVVLLSARTNEVLPRPPYRGRQPPYSQWHPRTVSRRAAADWQTGQVGSCNSSGPSTADLSPCWPHGAHGPLGGPILAGTRQQFEMFFGWLDTRWDPAAVRDVLIRLLLHPGCEPVGSHPGHDMCSIRLLLHPGCEPVGSHPGHDMCSQSSQHWALLAFNAHRRTHTHTHTSKHTCTQVHADHFALAYIGAAAPLANTV